MKEEIPMLENLKRTIREDIYGSSLLEAAAEQISQDDDDIRDTMLDDPDAIIIGAENDPEIEKIVNSLPDTVIEDDEVTTKDIEKITEEYVPESAADDDSHESDDDYDDDDDDVDDAF